MKRIIVSGATGMIGVALIESAIRRDIEVYAQIRPGTSRENRLPASKLIHPFYADIKDLRNIGSLPLPCDAFYHFAWSGTQKSERDDPFIQEKNLRYTLDAVELAYRCGCKKFIGAGSQAEYGPVNGVINEKTVCVPESAYGMIKYIAGLLSRKLCDRYGMTHIWGRIFSVYGRYDNNGSMLDYAIRQFMCQKTALFSAGDQLWDYLYEKDAGEIFCLLGEREEQSSIYRIANGVARPLKSYINIVADRMDAAGLCLFAEKGNVSAGLQADVSDLKTSIGFKAYTDFHEGVQYMIDYYKAMGINY